MLYSEFVITNKKIIIKTGIISRNIFEMNIPKIESVTVNQNILGRLFNYGDITIIGSGSSQQLFKTIKNPFAFRKAFQEINEENS